jgi:hypothetical protein
MAVPHRISKSKTKMLKFFKSKNFEANSWIDKLKNILPIRLDANQRTPIKQILNLSSVGRLK